MRLTHIPALDGLRAVAVLLVLWVHFPYVAGNALSQGFTQIGHALRAGYIGVDIFFCLSGFLVTRLLLVEKRTTGRITLAMFYKRRALRIFPIYYLAVILAQFIPGDHSGLGYSLLYLVNFYHPFHTHPDPLEHTWSLCVEEHFYLVWPLLVMILPRARAQVALTLVLPGLCLSAAIAYVFVFDSSVAAELIYMSTPTRIISLSLGASLAYETEDGNTTRANYALPLAMAGLVILLGAYLARKFEVIPSGGIYWCFALVGYASLSRGLLTAIVSQPRGWTMIPLKLLTLPPLLYIGRISYGIYLYHYLILFAVGLAPHLVETTGGSVERVIVALALTGLAAIVSYEFLERPLLAIRPQRSVPSRADVH